MTTAIHPAPVPDAGGRGWVAVILAVIAGHVALAIAFVGHIWVTPAATTMLLTTMIAYCLTRMRYAPASMRWRWIMLAIAFLFWMSAFWAILWLQWVYGDGKRLYFDYLFYLSRLAPYLMILARAGDPDDGRAYRSIDIAQATLLTGLLFSLIYPALFPIAVMPGEDWNERLSLYHQIGNISVAVLAILAIPAQPDTVRRRFATALAVLLASYAALASVLNHFVFKSAHAPPPGHFANALVGLPFLLFVLIETRSAPPHPLRRSTLIGMLMPTAFCGATMAVAFAIGSLGSAIAAGVALMLMGGRAAMLQRDLLRVERFVARLVEHLPDAVCVVGADDIVKSVNPAAERLFGPAITGRPFAPLHHAFGTTNEHDGTVETERGDCFVMAEVGLDDGDRVVRLTDITVLRATEREREEALQLLGHDIRAPFAAILTLLRKPAEAPVDAMARHARQGLAIADDFVRLARARSAALAMEPVDLPDAAAEAVDLISAKAHARGIPLENNGDAPADGVWVDGDRSLLIRAVQNLLDNAIRFALPGTTVRYGTHVEGDRARFVVSSTGKDLPPDRHADPFARFGGRADAVGLGLALVQVASQRHGGAATYRRERDRNVFTIDMPISPPA